MNQDYLKKFPTLQGITLIGRAAQVRTLMREMRSGGHTEAEYDELIAEMKRINDRPRGVLADKSAKIQRGIAAYKNALATRRLGQIFARRRGKVSQSAQVKVAHMGFGALRIRMERAR